MLNLFQNQTIIKPCCVDILTDIEDAINVYPPFTSDGHSLIFNNIAKYLNRIGLFYNQYEKQYYQLDPSTGIYYTIVEEDIISKIYDYIGYINGLFNVRKYHIDSILQALKAKYNLNELNEKFDYFLRTDERGIDYSFDYNHADASLFQLNNGIFNPFLEYDGLPFKLLPNCGLYFSQSLMRYDVNFIPILKEDIFSTMEYEDFLKILGDHETVVFFLWWAGVLFFTYPFKKPMFLLLYGPGGSGKDALASCIKSILGRESYSDNTLFNLITPREISNFDKRRLNIASELEGYYDKKLIGAIKRLTGGGEVNVDPKFKSQKSIFPPALLLLGNVFPELDPSDTGIKRRTCIIDCSADVEKSGVYWQELLTDPEHKNWIFNAAYYIWVENKDKLPYQMKSDSMLKIEDRMRALNPFVSWLEYYFVSSNYDDIREGVYDRSLTELYDSYSQYMYELGPQYTPMPRLKFSEKMQNDYRLVLKPKHNVRVFRYKEKS